MEPTRAELEAAYCWDPSDNAGTPEMTAFRRRTRLHHARWRESEGFPIGTHPIRPQPGRKVRPVGNRLPLDFALSSGANFVTKHAHAAAAERTKLKEPRQTFDAQRLWAELLWSPALSCNLFGDLAADLRRADRAVHTWWPDTPGTVRAVRFEHSPGRLDPAFLGALIVFNAAFELDLGDGSSGVIGVVVKYHERRHPEVPKPVRVEHYRSIARKSKAFARGAIEHVSTDLTVTWLEHLLVHSMLQHSSKRWRWGRLVLVYPEGNTDYAALASKYQELLRDASTFVPMTLEQLLGTGALARTATSALRARYLPSVVGPGSS